VKQGLQISERKILSKQTGGKRQKLILGKFTAGM
jgi:hypothetical protein